MQGDRFQGHGKLRAPILIFAMMAEDEVFQCQSEGIGKGFSRQFFCLSDLLIEDLDANHQVTDELAFVAVRQFALIVQFACLTAVMEEGPEDQDVAIEIRVVRGNRVTEFEQAEDVFQQATAVGMMVFDSGGSSTKVFHEGLVHEVAIGQIPEVHVAHASQNLAHAAGHRVQLLRSQRDEVGFIDAAGVDRFDSVEDRLQVAVVVLRGAGRTEVIAVFEHVVQAIIRVPQHAGHRTGFVGKPDLKIEIPVAICPQLLF